MQQPPTPRLAEPPSIWRVALGTVLGNIGCFLAYFLVAICIIAVLALSGPQISNIFSRVTNGLTNP